MMIVVFWQGDSGESRSLSFKSMHDACAYAVWLDSLGATKIRVVTI